MAPLQRSSQFSCSEPKRRIMKTIIRGRGNSLHVYLSCLSAITAMACSEGAADLDTGVAEEELSANDFDFLTIWPSSIDVCFSNTAQYPQADYDAAKDIVMSALHETWEAYSSLQFHDIGDCVQWPLSGTMRIRLTSSSGAGRCGQGGDCSVGMADPSSIADVAVHEVGHALGVPHEHQRADATGTTWEQPLCAYEQNIYDTGNADQRANRVWKASIEKLTLYDPLSIMHYCRTQNGRAAGDHHLTQLDALGIEMLYPPGLSAGVYESQNAACDMGCFEASDRLVTRINGKITTRWKARGGLNIVANWWLPGNTSQNAEVIRATTIGNYNDIVFSYEDDLGRQHFVQETKEVLISDDAHTAVLLSLL
jgi:hypothetical protein